MLTLLQLQNQGAAKLHGSWSTSRIWAVRTMSNDKGVFQIYIDKGFSHLQVTLILHYLPQFEMKFEFNSFLNTMTVPCFILTKGKINWRNNGLINCYLFFSSWSKFFVVFFLFCCAWVFFFFGVCVLCVGWYFFFFFTLSNKCALCI